MTALHKPERATYGQAVEAQYPYYKYEHMVCDEYDAECWGTGPKYCC